jgi:monovalent cation:H+ antiporter-2, CPA2 family
MPEVMLIRDLGIVWFAALLAGYLCVRLKQPIIAGYLLAGIAIGPHALGLISETEQISVLSELGVALLLFALGVEVSLKDIFSSAARSVSAGILQVVGTTAAFWIIAYGLGLVTDPRTGFIFGAICALSSTVVITKVLMDRGETDSNHGRILITILLIQDLSLVPIISLLPALQAASPVALLQSLAIALVKAGVLVGAIFLGATKVVPPALHWVTKSNSREIFLLTVVALCVGIALLSKELGLSLALGAFLAGLMISESEFGHQALSQVIPLKDLFSIVFFVSVGMLLNPVFIGEHFVEVLIFVVLLVIVKAVVAGLSSRIVTNSFRDAIIVGVGLAQVGEFSFILASIANAMGLLPANLYNLFIAGAVVTLIAAPGLVSMAPHLLAKNTLRKQKKGTATAIESVADETNHVILCGYGRTGEFVGLVLHSLQIPFLVIDTNVSVIQRLRKGGTPAIYGDAHSHHVLLKANLCAAATVIVTIPDPIAAATIISICRAERADLTILARAHRTSDIDMFQEKGANAVVQPEFECSIELTKLALRALNVDTATERKAVRTLAAERARLYRTQEKSSTT